MGVATGKAGTVTKLGEWLLIALAAIPYVIGWIIGVIVRITLWTIAAVLAGYHAGRGDDE